MMSSKKAKTFIVLFIVVLLAASASVLVMYVQNCKQELREVDRYAQPYIVTVMEALGTWRYETIAPHLTDEYLDLLPEEEWKKELGELAVLGGLQSFGRPRFVTHAPFKKYFVCESAVEVYSVSAEFEHANAVVRWHFVNDCGKLKISTFKVTSAVLKPKLEYLEGIEFDKQDGDLNIDIEEFEHNAEQQDLDLENYDLEQAPPTLKKKATEKNQPKGQVYRY